MAFAQHGSLSISPLTLRFLGPGLCILGLGLLEVCAAEEFEFGWYVLDGWGGRSVGSHCSHVDGYCNPQATYLDIDSSRVTQWQSACNVEWPAYLDTVDVEGSISSAAGQVAFMTANTYDLKYSRGGPWVYTELVDSTGIVGVDNSIAIDLQGRPCIAYQDLTLGALKFALREEQYDWTLEVVDHAGDTGHLPSLAIDSAGSVHICYARRVKGLDARDEMLHACRTGGVWEISIAGVFAAGAIQSRTSIVLDSDGEPWIAFGDAVTRGLWLGRRTAGSWSWVVVDSSQAGAHASLRIDDDGYPHIAYFHEAAANLKYAHEDSAGWTIQTVDSVGEVGAWAWLELRWGGSPTISYFDETEGDLKIASALRPGSVPALDVGIDNPLSVSPSPLGSEGGTIELVGAEVAEPTAAVYDVTGRLVRAIPITQQSPLRWSGYWDGSDGRNEAVPSGMYWVQIRLLRGVASTQIAVVR